MSNLERGIDVFVTLCIYGFFIAAFGIVALTLFPYCLLAAPFVGLLWIVGAIVRRFDKHE